MKYLLFIISLVAFSFTSSDATAQSAKIDTVTLNVPGVCNMCKSRIETTTYDVPGVKTATWDLETDVLTAVISTKKTNRQQIADALAKKGYRSELAKADPDAYAKLPGCCQYDSGIEKHDK
jgi:copper chaperone CopZ